MTALTLDEMIVLSKLPKVLYERVVPVKRHHRNKNNE